MINVLRGELGHRNDEIIRRNDSVVVGLTQPQLVSLGLLAFGAAIVIARRNAPRPALA